MRISKLKIEKALTDEKRLKEIDLTKKPFGSTVALVGKNGAGKSRILKPTYQRL
jgi:ABC-type polysaccharide/polyol phosphate transport system ATPase subunit